MIFVSRALSAGRSEVDLWPAAGPCRTSDDTGDLILPQTTFGDDCHAESDTYMSEKSERSLLANRIATTVGITLGRVVPGGAACDLEEACRQWRRLSRENSTVVSDIDSAAELVAALTADIIALPPLRKRGLLASLRDAVNAWMRSKQLPAA
jgi:hypothetical protein